MSIYTIKEQEVPDTPLLLFECRLADSEIERWATHEVTVEGQLYKARVLAHNTFELKSGSEDGIDGASRVSLTLANADSHFSQIESITGFKGAALTARFVFYDLKNNVATTPSTVLFKGIANPPEQATESKFRLSFTSRLNLQRVLLPNVRIQRRCPWIFPTTAEQRALAPHGGDDGKYSPYFRCGYSPDQPGGAGNLNGSEPFTSCDFTRAQCEQRGMFDKDSSDRVTARFGGIEFVPASILVRSAGESGRHVSTPVENTARYNDFVPMVYGTAWLQPPIVFARNDGNLTRMEVLVALGELEGILKVIVNGIEIPLGQDGKDMTATGWFNVVSRGNRTGGFNLDFTDGNGTPQGDPYGSMAYLSVVVPNRISDGRALPKVEALVQGLRISVFNTEGNYTGEAFSNNPALVILDVLRRIGWRLDELDLASFGKAAERCAELIPAKDLNGNTIPIPRFQCNLALRRRQSAAEVLRGIRNAASLFLTFGEGGRLQLRPESTLTVQQPTPPAGSNAVAPILGGWAAYEFGDGSNEFSGILRRENGESSVQVFSRSTADTPNRISLEFQDAFNEHQQDSVSLIEPDDIVLVGQEVAATVNALGTANLDQAIRVARLHLNKSIWGNTFVEFETSMKGLGIRPGDLITLTYVKEGFERQLFRVAKIAPSTNYRTATITAQIHDELWYSDDGGQGGRRRRRGSAEIGIPRPLVIKTIGEGENEGPAITESVLDESDGGARVLLTVEFTPPPIPGASRAAIPVLDLSAATEPSGGSLGGGQLLYYAVSATDADGMESELSFTVRADLLSSTGDTNQVRLQRLSFDADTVSFSVYRGPSPQQLEKIADNVPLASEFVDTGLESLLEPPPDPNYDHANFHWRFELQPAIGANIVTPTTVGNPQLNMVTNEHRGAVVRILKGEGAGQERNIIANDLTTVAINSPWRILPDTSSEFVIAEASWRFGAMSRTDRAEFEVPNRGAATVQISGRSANARDQECPSELSPLTRWRIGGGPDADTPAEPVFGLFPVGDGSLELVSVSFPTLDNTRTIAGGTLTLHYWDELSSPSAFSLAAAMDDLTDTLTLNAPGGAVEGAVIQVEAELMIVEDVLAGGTQYRVTRGAFETTAAKHEMLPVLPPVLPPVYHLLKRTMVVPFVRDFFGSPASGSYAHPIYLANARVAAAELYVTNALGESPAAQRNFTANVDHGLRTLSGGQMTLQVDGYLAIQSSASPPAVVNDWRAVRDVFAVVREAPTGTDEYIELRVLVNGTAYCDLKILEGATLSEAKNGFGLPPLPDKAIVTLDILHVPPSESGAPGRDLTVTLRS